MNKHVAKLRVVLNGVDITRHIADASVDYFPMAPALLRLRLYPDDVRMDADGTVVYSISATPSEDRRG